MLSTKWSCMRVEDKTIIGYAALKYVLDIIKNDMKNV